MARNAYGGVDDSLLFFFLILVLLFCTSGFSMIGGASDMRCGS